MDSEAPAFFFLFFISARAERVSATRLSQGVTVLCRSRSRFSSSSTAKSTITLSLVHDSHRPKVKYTIECNET